MLFFIFNSNWLVGDELTSGKPDRKEGLYCGIEHDDQHPLVQSKTPLHGQNLFPASPPQLGTSILDWIEHMTKLAHALMRGIALGLGLPPNWFQEHLTADPTVLFRIFHYPPGDDSDWGVAEHTDCNIFFFNFQVVIVVLKKNYYIFSFQMEF